MMSPSSSKRIVGEDLGAVGPGRQQVEHVADADAQAAQAGCTTALARVDRDPMFSLTFTS